MMTTFIDYSRQHYENVAGQPLPPCRSGKFVQLWLDSTEEFIVVAPKDLAAFHANILERFFGARDVSGEYNAKRDMYTHRDDAWTVIGGGRFELDDDARTLRLHSRSIGYGPFERPGLADRLSASPALTGYRITVE